MLDSVYKLLTLNRNAAISTFKLLKKLKGLDCIVWIPARDAQPSKQYEEGRRGSIFGYEDLVAYEEYESYADTLLIFNLFQEGFAGMGDDFDTFTSNTYCLTLGSERLPLQTIIEINFYGKRMNYKVDDHKSLYPSVVEQLFIKNILVPAT